MGQMQNIGMVTPADYKTKGKKGYMYFISAIVALGGMLFGYDTGVIAGALMFIEKTFSPTIWQQELVVSMVVAGAFFGALFSGKIANKYGRKRILVWTATTFIIGTLICSFSPDVWTLIFGRFILGLAVGVASYASPLYISEISLPDKRGFMVILNNMFLTGAQAASFLVGFYLQKYFSYTISWRLMIGVAIVPSSLFLLGLLFAPTSPRWLIMNGQIGAARNVLRRIRQNDKVEQEIEDIQKSMEISGGTLKELFSKMVRPVLIIGLVLGILQQFVGINTVMYYGPTIFKNIGFQGSSAQILATFGMGCLNFVMTIVAMFTADKFGRRKIMILGMAIAMVSLFILGYIMRVGVDSVSQGRPIAVLCLVAYMIGYAYSIGTMFWLILSEIFPLSVRGIGMGFAAGIQWGANFLVTATFLTVLSTFGASNTFWLYAVMCLITLLFSIFLLPETKGVSLETIERNLGRGLKSRNLGNPDHGIKKVN